MPHYLIQVAYKENAAKALVARPQERSEIVKKMMSALGGKLHSYFLSFGDYDVVAIVELPGNEEAVAMGLASVAGGALSRYHTTVLLTPEEATRAMKKAKKVPYTAPRAK